MTLLKRSLLCLAVILYFNSAPLDFALAANSNLDDQVTSHEPKSRISDIEDLPKGTGGKWLWALLGVVVVAGGAAAMAGGGGDDGGGGNDKDTGTVGGSW